MASIFVGIENKEKKEEEEMVPLLSMRQKRMEYCSILKEKMQYIETDKGFQELLYFSLTLMIKLKIYFSPADQFWLDCCNA